MVKKISFVKVATNILKTTKQIVYGGLTFMSDIILDRYTPSSVTLGIKVDKRKYRLDNAALGFSLMSNKRVSNVYRISCTLKELVDKEKLQEALTNVLPRFPYFRVSIRRGLIWGKWVTNLKVPEIQQEKKYTNQYMSQGRKRLLYRVIVNKNDINLECHHSLTDGHGGMIFLNSIIAEYYRIKGVKIENTSNILLPEDEPDILEFENSYEKHYKRKLKINIPRVRKRSFNMINKIEKAGVFHITNLSVSVESIKQKSKKLNVSITALLCAIYFDVLREIQEEQYKGKIKKHRPIRINIPVNLRRVLVSKTMRNFSLFIRPEVDPKRNNLSIEENAFEINEFLKDKIQPETFYPKIAKNIRSLGSFIMHITPFRIKRFFARIGYYFVRTPYYSGVLSNLGKIIMPEQLERYIDNYRLAIGPGTVNKERIGVASFQDKLIITFSRVIKESMLIDRFSRRLYDLGIQSKQI